MNKHFRAQSNIFYLLVAINAGFMSGIKVKIVKTNMESEFHVFTDSGWLTVSSICLFPVSSCWKDEIDRFLFEMRLKAPSR